MRQRLREERGFTLVEMLVVLAIIGILAAITAVTMGSSSEQAYVAAMQSDLRGIATAQEAYVEEQFAQNGSGRYAGRMNQLDVSTSVGVQIRLRADADGWAAQARHPRTTRRCAMYRGDIRPFDPASQEGKIACTR